MNLTSSSLKRPVTTLMIFLCVAVVGLISIKLLPLEFFPDMAYPFVGVEVPYPGSTPEEVEREIARPAEEALATISGIKRMFSNCNENSCFIGMLFNWDQEINVKALEAKEKMDGIRHLLPDDLERFFVLKFNTADEEILTLRLSSNRDLSNAYDMLNRNIKQRLERIDGVAAAQVFSMDTREILVAVDKAALESLSISVDQILMSLSMENLNLPAGRVTERHSEYLLRTLGEFQSLDDIRNTIIGSTQAGQPIYLADVYGTLSRF